MKMRWSSQPSPSPEELEEERKLLQQYLTFPFRRVRGYLTKVNIDALDSMLRWREDPDHKVAPNEIEYDAATVLPGQHLRPQQPQQEDVLYNPKWSEEEKKKKDQRYLQEWQEVWNREEDSNGGEGEWEGEGTWEYQPGEGDAAAYEEEWPEEREPPRQGGRGWAIRETLY